MLIGFFNISFVFFINLNDREENNMFQSKINQRIRLVLIIFILIFFVILVRVIYVQTISYKKLSLLSDDLWSRELPITAERGKILDRNGVVLADNKTTSTLIIIPNQVEDKEKTAKIISEILNVSYDKIYERVSKKSSIERVHPEGRRLSIEIADKISSYNFPGVYLVKESQRYYPYGSLLSHTLGYVGIDNQGLAGIELMYDFYLKGTDGAIKYYSDAKGTRLNLAEVYEQPQDGVNMTLTINYEIQMSLERELDNAVKRLCFDNKNKRKI